MDHAVLQMSLCCGKGECFFNETRCDRQFMKKDGSQDYILNVALVTCIGCPKKWQINPGRHSGHHMTMSATSGALRYAVMTPILAQERNGYFSWWEKKGKKEKRERKKEIRKKEKWKDLEERK